MNKFPPFKVGPDGLITEIPLGEIRCSPNIRGNVGRRLNKFMVSVALVIFAVFCAIAIHMDHQVLTVEKSNQTGDIVRVLDYRGNAVDPELTKSRRYEVVYVP